MVMSAMDNNDEQENIWSNSNPSSSDLLQSLLQSQANVVKTEYSTFTYFITSLEDGQTVTSTDIVVSSNVVTTLPSIEATPLLQDVASDQVSGDIG